LTVKINLKRAERKVMPEGDYLCNIAVAEIRPTKDKLSENLHLELTVDSETHPEFAGVRIYDERSLKEQSWFRVVEFLEAVKRIAPGEQLPADENGDLEFEEDELVGESVGCSVSVDEDYDPEHPRNRVDSYFNPEEAEGEEVEPLTGGKGKKS